MRKLAPGLILLAALPAAAVLGLLATGTVDSTSLRMALNTLFGVQGPEPGKAMVQEKYAVPQGFSLQLYATDLPRARFLRFTAAGDLLVSRPHAGDIQLLRRDADGDGGADAMETLIGDLHRPQGMDFYGDWLYIAERDRIGRIAFDHAKGQLAGPYEVVVDNLTGDGNHWSKTLRFGPDGLLYLSQGSTCNICEEQDERRATMMRFRPDGSAPEIFASGLRNSVGFDWAPWSGELYATDNGRDMLGDDFPPCELNLIEQGNFYGWPYFNGNNVPDPDMGADPLGSERQPTPPVHGFRAHNAPLGMTFINAQDWPEQYRRSALVALHGSWNRSTPDGYKLVSLHWSEAGIEERDFLTGFNSADGISGRPVDVLQGPDGAVYISDDYAGAVYRVHYGETRDSMRPVPVTAAPRFTADGPPAWLEGVDLEQMSRRGASLYQRHNCRSCHELGDSPRLLTGLSERLGHQGIVEVLQAPPAPMPVFLLTEEERRALAVFLLARSGATLKNE